MLKILLLLSFLFSQLFSAVYTAKEAWNHVGEKALVCGKVVNIYYAKKSRGKPTFLNLERNYPNQLFTVIIWDESRSDFKNIQNYKGKQLCFEGTIESYKERPQMIIESPRKITPER